MRAIRPRQDCLLSIDPCTKGFGFAVFHGPNLLVDWGVARVWGRSDEEFISRIDGIIDRYNATLVVLEDDKPRRSERMTRRLHAIAEFVAGRRLGLSRVSPGTVRAMFEPSLDKHDVAVAIAKMFPELEPHVPPRRTAWMGEDERTNLFDAVGLAVAVLRSINTG